MIGRSSRLPGSQAPRDAQAASSHDPDALLADIAHTQELSRRLHGYARAAPHLIVWGVVWLACDLGQYGRPDLSGLIWTAGIVLGGMGSFLIGVRQYSAGARSGTGWRWAASVITVIAGMTALIWILEPRLPEQVNAASSLLVAMIYAVLGIWRGMRFLVLGLLVGTVVVVAWSAFRDLFPLVMAVTGGGALLLGGWWLLREERT